MSKIVGILGGMGPYATLDLFQKIVLNTPTKTEQEHLQIIVHNNPKIPPRRALSEQHESPLPALIQSALSLEKAGADFIIMPCHTAHIWFDEVRAAIRIPFYSMVENTVKETARAYANQQNNKILLLATETTIHSQIYQQAFMNSSFELIIPTVKEQGIVDHAIKSTKEGILQENIFIKQLKMIIEDYYEEGISLLAGCCTEIPLMYPYLGRNMEMIDPTLMLAKMAIEKAI